MASRWDTWVERYKPIQNTIAQHRPEFMFETFGDEYQFVVETNKTMPGKVWTLTEGDNGRLCISDGVTTSTASVTSSRRFLSSRRRSGPISVFPTKRWIA